MADAVITAQARSEFGKGPARRLRARGLVPGVIYQQEGPSLAFAADGHDLWMLLGQGGGRRHVVEIAVAGDAPVPAVFMDWQLDPVRGDIAHIDFKQIDPTEVAAANRRLDEEAERRAEEHDALMDQIVKSRQAAALAEEAMEAGEGEGGGEAEAPEDAEE